jgi:hypothetical protein
MRTSAWSASIIAAQAFFATLPQAAREELKRDLKEIADEALKLQQQLVPVYEGKERKGVVPGRLRDALTIAEGFTLLRVRIGLPQMRSRRAKTFYAIWMEYGRRGGTVPVRRLKVGARAEWLERIGTGRARARLKPQDLLSKARTMRVSPLPPRPFVHIEDRIDAITSGYIARFWDNVEAAAGGSS